MHSSALPTYSDARFFYWSRTSIKVDIEQDHIAHIVSDVKLDKPLYIVVDVVGNIVPKLFYFVDGNLPNHHPSSSKLTNFEDVIQ